MSTSAPLDPPTAAADEPARSLTRWERLRQRLTRAARSRDTRRQVLLGLCLAGTLALLVNRPPAPAAEHPQRPWSVLRTRIQHQAIDSLVLHGALIDVYSKGPDEMFQVALANTTGAVERTVALADSAHVSVRVATPTTRLVEWIPIVLQVALYGLLATVLIRQLGTGGGTSSLGGQAATSTTRFTDIAGNQSAIAELRDLIVFIQQPKQFLAVGAHPPRGALLEGPPGTGKTLMARALAGEAGVPFYQITGSEVTGMFVGLGVLRVKRLFASARKTGGVIFIDEIDVLGAARGRNTQHNEDDRTLNQLLVELDGFTGREGVFVLGATNRADLLDPALLRPGRLDRRITVALPNQDERAAILALHAAAQKVPLAPDVELRELARLLPGASGAHLAHWLNEAAIIAGRAGRGLVTRADLQHARERLLLGAEQAAFTTTEHTWDVVAAHEAGHALAGLVDGRDEQLHKLTIRPRGGALGVAYFAPLGDRILVTRTELEAQLTKALAGRAAEIVIFGPEIVTTGAASDLEEANRVAYDMVAKYGLGPTTAWLVRHPQTSAHTLAQIDADVQGLLQRAYERAAAICTTYRPALDAIRHRLRAVESMDGAEVVALCHAHGVPMDAAVAATAAAVPARDEPSRLDLRPVDTLPVVT